MPQKFFSKIALSIVLLLGLFPTLSPAVVHAAEIRRSLCTGSNLEITANPSGTPCADLSTDAGSNANRLITTIVNILSGLVGAVAVIMIIYAGFRFVTSGGNSETVGKAKNTIIYAIIGLLIVAFSQLIVHFVLAKPIQSSTPPPPPPPPGSTAPPPPAGLTGSAGPD
jgi:energy-converting hydrogenase Eha subunit B